MAIEAPKRQTASWDQNLEGTAGLSAVGQLPDGLAHRIHRLVRQWAVAEC